MDTPLPGLLGSARQVLAALIEIGQTRLELASTEVEEERLRVAELLLYATAALFFLAIGLVLTSLLLVIFFWDSHRELVLAGLSAANILLGLGLGVVWRRKSSAKPKLLAATLAELQRDREALQGVVPGRR